MKFAGWQKQSLVDYPGKITTVLFTQGCNLRCPFCQNSSLVLPELFHKNLSFLEEEIFVFLKKRKKVIDAVTVTGGEPLLHSELEAFFKRVKGLGHSVKLDTNGTFPSFLKRLVEEGLLDFIATDVKAPLDFGRYKEFTGQVLTEKLFENIKESIDFLLALSKKDLIRVEFRITLIKGKHSWQDIMAMGKALKGASRLALQTFRPDNILDSSWQKFSAYSEEELKAFKLRLEKYIDNVIVR